jgi:hypothetical protein
MHYRNGREAKNGDRVIPLCSGSGEIQSFGVLQDATPGNDFCNGRITPNDAPAVACLCDCLHVDDVAAMFAEKGLDKRPSTPAQEAPPMLANAALLIHQADVQRIVDGEVVGADAIAILRLARVEEDRIHLAVWEYERLILHAEAVVLYGPGGRPTAPVS